MFMMTMIAKRKLTLTRSVTLGAILLLIAYIKFLTGNYPLDIISTYQYHVNIFRRILSGDTASPAENGAAVEFKRRRVLSPCKLYHLQQQTQTRDDVAISSQCKRVQPVPGSCDIADQLFGSKAPDDCPQPSLQVCKLKKAAKGWRVECVDKQCDQTLAGAAVDPQTGELRWRKFPSPLSLEKWINGLMKPAKSKKHFGFCFIGCGGDWVDYNGKDITSQDDLDLYGPFQRTQLLVLPPVVPSAASTSAKGNFKSHSKVDINFNIIFIDSVSRQHFFRSLPKTVEWFRDTLNRDKASDVTLLDFELVQSVRSRTFETLQTLFAGEINPSVKPFGVLELPPEPLKTEALLKDLKEKGYWTLWLEDLCYMWEWGISKDLRVHNKSFTQEETWKQLQRALKHASIDSMEVTYAMCKVLDYNNVRDHFHGPDRVCYNGRDQHDYLLDYLRLYQQALVEADLPYFTFLETNVGHEDTGRRIQTFDKAFLAYLENAASQENTLTIILSDHGNSYGQYLEMTMEGRMELFHPHLFMLVPRSLARVLGSEAMAALRRNQKRLISHLDLHYMLHTLTGGSNVKSKHHGPNGKIRVPKKHREYGVTGRGLMGEVSPNRSCNHIPRIMPNLCICENFEMPVEIDAYHSLFAHLAVGKINNQIQRQFQQGMAASRTRQVRGFGRCRRLFLGGISNIRKSFSAQNSISLKMDLQIPLDYDSSEFTEEEPLSSSSLFEIFFVAIQYRLGDNSSVVMETLDRMTAYSKYSVCADSSVKLQLCICDRKSKIGDKLEPELPTSESLQAEDLFMHSQAYFAEGSGQCLLLVIQKNDHGGLFYVANLCEGKLFNVLFRLETENMVVSDPMPRQEDVFPGQEIFLCMAVKIAPKLEWNWVISLQYKLIVLKR